MPTRPRDHRRRVAGLRSIADVIEIGRLLLEAQDQLEHGEWLPWVERELDFSERTAQRYVSAYCFSLEYVTVTDLNLTRSALYQIAGGGYEPDEIAAVLAVAAEERVPRQRVDEIVVAFDEAKEAEAETGATNADVVEPDDHNEPELEADEYEAADPLSEHMAAQAEAEAILDGTPPELPPTQSAPEVDFITPAFDAAVSKLRELSSKSLDAFQKCDRTPDEIDAAADFLRHVAEVKSAREGAQK